MNDPLAVVDRIAELLIGRGSIPVVDVLADVETVAHPLVQELEPLVTEVEKVAPALTPSELQEARTILHDHLDDGPASINALVLRALHAVGGRRPPSSGHGRSHAA